MTETVEIPGYQNITESNINLPIKITIGAFLVFFNVNKNSKLVCVKFLLNGLVIVSQFLSPLIIYMCSEKPLIVNHFI